MASFDPLVAVIPDASLEIPHTQLEIPAAPAFSVTTASGARTQLATAMTRVKALNRDVAWPNVGPIGLRC